jgi:hypothetical protein
VAYLCAVKTTQMKTSTSFQTILEATPRQPLVHDLYITGNVTIPDEVDADRGFVNCTLDGVVFDRIPRLLRFVFIGCTFKNCTFSNVKFYTSEITNCVFVDCKIYNTGFIECDFSGTVFKDCSAIGTLFDVCKFKNARIERSDFSTATFENAREARDMCFDSDTYPPEIFHLKFNDEAIEEDVFWSIRWEEKHYADLEHGYDFWAPKNFFSEPLDK